MDKYKSNESGWDRWGNHVLEELKRMNSNIESVSKNAVENEKRVWIELSALKVKAGVWGMMGGALLLIPTLLFWFLGRH